MPGLVGFVGQADKACAEKLITGMAQAMKHADWYQIDAHYDNGFGLARIGPGLLNPQPQPIWNEARTSCIVMEGEIFGYQELKQKLVDGGHCFQVHNDAEFALHLYEECGTNFASHLNGAFVAAIFTPRTGELILVNDHLGMRPLYYTFEKGSFVFASGVRALLAHPDVSCAVDLVSIAQMLSFEYVLGNRTLLRDVQLLAPGSVLRFASGEITISSHSRVQFADVYQKRSEDDYLEGFIYHLRQAVARQYPVDLPAGLNLSGGLDSRMLLGLLMERMPKGSLETFTFGVPGCDDARSAQELAKTTGTRHRFFELKPDYLLGIAGEAVRLTDGLASCIHIHALANLRVQAQSIRILYTGYLLDCLTSPDCDRTWFASFDDESAIRLLFKALNRSLLFGPDERAELLTPQVHRQVNGSFEESFRATVMECRRTSIVDWLNTLELQQRQRRFTGNGNEVLRSQLIARTPFADKDLVQYCLAIPPGLRLERHLMIKALQQAFHKLAKIPWEKTGFPLTDCGRDLVLRFEKQARWRLYNAGLRGIPLGQRRSYVAYNRWLRTVLRPWVEETLLNKNALERGYFQPDAVRRLVSEHMAGANHANRLGILLSIEIWHKQFLD